jgi:glutamate-1-semialdehyde 2,1-aminomutase
LGDLLRARLTEVFRELHVPGQVTGDASLFRILLSERPIRGFRDIDRGCLARTEQLFYRLLDAGVLLSPGGLGCLSTPMTEREVEEMAVALGRALASLQ